MVLEGEEEDSIIIQGVSFVVELTVRNYFLGLSDY